MSFLLKMFVVMMKIYDNRIDDDVYGDDDDDYAEDDIYKLFSGCVWLQKTFSLQLWFLHMLI